MYHISCISINNFIYKGTKERTRRGCLVLKMHIIVLEDNPVKYLIKEKIHTHSKVGDLGQHSLLVAFCKQRSELKVDIH